MSEASSLKATACSSADASEQFLVSEWDSLNSTSQNGDFGATLTPTPFNIGLLGSRDVHCSNGGLMEQIPGVSCFNSVSFLDVLGSTGLSADGQVANCHTPTNSQFNNSQGSEKDCNWRKRKNQPHCSDFESQSPLNRSQDSGSEQQKNVLHGTLKAPTEKDEKKQKNEQLVGVNTRKLNLRQTKENPQNGDTPKEDYIHVRAKRGQATNSHSLAERVRREKISERMRFLQNLVPGCNKITGKAVMLDEIINYVQSLQRQVEFLSMKLATVNPELSFDIEQILSKDIHHSQAGSSGSLGFVHGIGTTSPHLHGFNPQALMQTEIMTHNLPSSQDMMKNNLPHIPNTSQALGLWDNEEFQNVFQMGFMSNMHVSSTEPQGNQ